MVNFKLSAVDLTFKAAIVYKSTDFISFFYVVD